MRPSAFLVALFLLGCFENISVFARVDHLGHVRFTHFGDGQDFESSLISTAPGGRFGVGRVPSTELFPPPEHGQPAFEVINSAGNLKLSNVNIALQSGVRVVIHASARIQAEITIDGSRWTPIESTPQPGRFSHVFESRQLTGRRLSVRITFEQRVMPVFVYSMGILAFPKPSPLPLVLSDFTFADELFRGYARSQFHLEGIDWSIDLSNINQLSQLSALIVVDPPPAGDPFLQATQLPNLGFWLSPVVSVERAASVQVTFDASVAAIRGQGPEDALVAQYMLNQGPWVTFYAVNWEEEVDCWHWCENESQRRMKPRKCVCGANRIVEQLDVPKDTSLRLRIGMKASRGVLQIDNVRLSAQVHETLPSTQPTTQLFTSTMFFAAVYDDLVEDDKAHDDIVAALTQAITDLGVPVVSLNVAPGSIVATVLTSSEEHQTLLDDLVRQGSVSIMFRQVQLNATANPTPRDCKLDWAPWGSCSVSCGNGTHQRQQFIVALEDDGGQPCSPLMTESRPCVNSPCLSVQTTVAPSNDQQGSNHVGLIIGVALLAVIAAIALILIKYFRYFKRSQAERIVPVSVTALSYKHRLKASPQRERSSPWNPNLYRDQNLKPSAAGQQDSSFDNPFYGGQEYTAEIEFDSDSDVSEGDMTSSEIPRRQIYESQASSNAGRVQQMYVDPNAESSTDDIGSVYVMPTPRPLSSSQAVIYTHPEVDEPPPSPIGLQEFLSIM